MHIYSLFSTTSTYTKCRSTLLSHQVRIQHGRKVLTASQRTIRQLAQVPPASKSTYCMHWPQYKDIQHNAHISVHSQRCNSFITKLPSAVCILVAISVGRIRSLFCSQYNYIAFSALTLLVSHEEDHPACKKIE